MPLSEGRFFASLLWLLHVAVATSDLALDCAGRGSSDNEECQQPLKSVAAVVPGSFYVAKLPCLDCPVVEVSGQPHEREYEVISEENDLFFNISLSHDNRTLFLNDKPIFPTVSTNPHPPRIFASQVPPNFTRADLENTIQCTREPCSPRSAHCQCLEKTLSTVTLDFDYRSRWVESHPETETEKWEITFDTIGGHSGIQADPVWKFNNSEQYMLRIIVQGKEIEGERYAGEKDLQAASSLFGMLEESEVLYSYEIAGVELMERSYTFTPHRKLGFWKRIRLFFGYDIVREDGHLIYLQEEWGSYGKKGTLRNHVGIIIHDWRWDLVFIILGSVTGGALALYVVYKLFWLVKQQRELARWDGMDAVWAEMRRERGDEEQDELLDGRYRDEPDEELPPRYTDETQTNKPLPSKPLPEKPLPAVPLIDA